MKNMLLSFKKCLYVFFIAAFFLLVGFVNSEEKVEGITLLAGAQANTSDIGDRDISYIISVANSSDYAAIEGATVYYGWNTSSSYCSTSLPNSLTAGAPNYNNLKGFTSTNPTMYAVEMYDSGLIGTLYFHVYVKDGSGNSGCFNSTAFKFKEVEELIFKLFYFLFLAHC